MTEDPPGTIDYDEAGSGPAILFVPGSCSTGAAWRAVIARLGETYRSITTSLPGYGGSIERRNAADRSIMPIASAIESVICQAGGRVHLVGHSFGGLVGLAVALRGRVKLDSLAILEAPAPGMLSTFGKHDQYAGFRDMTGRYIDDFRAGNSEAIGAMVDFYGGAGTFAAWPEAVRGYAVKTTATNILDWESAYAFQPTSKELASLNLPVLVTVGQNSNPAVIEGNALIKAAIPGATFTKIEGASHFMIATHAEAVAKLIIDHVTKVASVDRGRISTGNP